MALSLLKRNVLANFFGRGFAALLSLLVIPVYVSLLGIEAYGLIGFFATLAALTVIFDVGLSITANRELARLTANDAGSSAQYETARDTTRTLEVMQWLCAIALGCIASLLAGPVSMHWLQIGEIPPDQARQAIQIMALVLAICLPTHFYSHCLLGLQKHVLLNFTNVAASIFQVGGAILVLTYIDTTLTAFFTWQGIARLAQTVLLAVLTWRSFPHQYRRPQFQFSHLTRIWRFSAGMTASALVGLLLVQTDNLILSRLLPLDQFGYYALARSVAQSLLILVSPIFVSTFPQFSQLLVLHDEHRLRELYHRTSELIALMVIPAGIVLALFSRKILWAWTGDITLAEQSAPIVSFLAVGATVQGLSHTPQALRIAAGWTRFIFLANSIALCFMVPMIFSAAHLYGPAMAALGWSMIYVAAYCIAQPIMHRRLLRGALRRWYIGSGVRPACAVLIVAGLGYWYFPVTESRVASAVEVLLILAMSAVAALITLPWLRRYLFDLSALLLHKARH